MRIREMLFDCFYSDHQHENEVRESLKSYLTAFFVTISYIRITEKLPDCLYGDSVSRDKNRIVAHDSVGWQEGIRGGIVELLLEVE